MPYTIANAKSALVVPPAVANVNTVQDGQWRLRDALKLASHFHADSDAAPDYVLRAVAGLESWIRHASR